MKKILEFSIYIYILLGAFGGIIVKFISNSDIALNIKSVMPDFILIVIILIALLYLIKNKVKISSKIYLLKLAVVYMSCIVILNIFTNSNLTKILFSLRDVYLPFLVLFLLLKIKFDQKEKEKIFSNVCKIFIVQIILGFILAIVQNKMGSEWTANFYTGYSFYGLDERTGIKVWHASGQLRVPSIAGNSVLFAFYNLISYYFIKNHKVKGRKIYLIISIMNMILSTNKTVLIILILEYFIRRIIKSNNKLKILTLITSIMIMVIVLAILPKINSGVYFSIKERFALWPSLFREIGTLVLFLPLRLFSIGAGNTGFLAVIDNSYLYILFSYGIIGLIMYSALCFQFIKKSIVDKNNLFMALSITLVYGGLTTNLFQGRVFVTPVFMLLFLIIDRKNV